MEDTYQILENIDNNPLSAVFGIFDGHSGDNASRFCAERLIPNLTAFSPEALRQAFIMTDIDFCTNTQNAQGGSTAVVAAIHNNSLLIANVGDSRALIVSRFSSE